MNDKERMDFEIEQRLSSEVWDASVARRVNASAKRRRVSRIAVFTGSFAAAALAAAVLSFALMRPDAVSAEGSIVLQQVRGSYNVSLGIPASADVDPVDAEIDEALWSR